METLRRHLAAVMFTDIEGYTALMQRDEEAARVARARHRGALEQAVAGHGGRVVQYFGDGSLSLFDSAVEAVTAAVEIQRALAGSDPVALRIGLHLGDVAYDEQGVYGDAVNIASRIESLCAPGGVLVSGRVRRELTNKPDLDLVHVGQVRLRNVKAPVDLYSVAQGDLPVPDLVGRVDGASGAVFSREGRAHLESFVGRSPYRPRGLGLFPRELPLVGRDRELAELGELLAAAEEGRGSVAFIRGERGVGKSRLAEALAASAADRGWMVSLGRCYPAERLVPFAPFVDAFLPVVRGLSLPDLRALSGGGEVLLRQIFPALAPALAGRELRLADPNEMRTRVFWQFASMLSGLARWHPQLVILDDLRWADASSLELLHFAARHTADDPVLFVCTLAEPGEREAVALRRLEHDLTQAGLASVYDVQPLTAEDVEEIVAETFGSRGDEVAAFARRLFTWTNGNPFFVEGVLEGLVDSGRLRPSGEGWTGWHVDAVELPRSVRDAVFVRLARLSDDARAVVRKLAVLGARTRHDVLKAVVELPPAHLDAVLAELRAHQITSEVDLGHGVALDFTHPLIRETVRADLAPSRRRTLHGRTARALEEYFGPSAEEHAIDLAYHYARAPVDEFASKAIRYLALAGRRALGQRANREAAEYFGDALERMDALVDPALREEIEAEGIALSIVEGLARARVRLGDYAAGLKTWGRALGAASSRGDARDVARIRRHMGLTLLWADRLEEAEEQLRLALQVAEEVGDRSLAARIQLALAAAIAYGGRSAEATELARRSLEAALELGDRGMEASAQSSLLQWSMWSGDLKRARSHGLRALELAAEEDYPSIAFWSHWALAVAEGMFGDLEELADRIRRATAIADEVGSPLLKLWAAEVSIEHAFSTGEWDRGIELGVWAIDVARRLNQRTLLPRLLVWTALIRIGRGELDVAKSYIDEAWEVSGADRAALGGPVDVHTVVPAHIGRASYLSATGELDEAIRVATVGVEIADRFGNVVWGLHRLLPILSEAHLRARNLDQAAEVLRRVREISERIGHALGLAWAEAGEAILSWLSEDSRQGAKRLRAAADRLDEIPMIWDAARVRRQLAGRLAEIGDREGAVAELERVLDTYVRLGALLELEKTKEMFTELGLQPPDAT